MSSGAVPMEPLPPSSYDLQRSFFSFFQCGHSLLEFFSPWTSHRWVERIEHGRVLEERLFFLCLFAEEVSLPCPVLF